MSNQDNNPKGYLFRSSTGARRTKPIHANTVRWALNEYAGRNHIVDENGKIFHFTNHAVRHTFSVKILNNGADILAVMELLAHASPKMAMKYAKLLDSTKRKAFDSAMRAGVFSFDSNEGQTALAGEDLPQDILDSLWQQHKLNAVDTPYGTCLQRSGGGCTFTMMPPCLTCNNGAPCKDRCVGAVRGDRDECAVHIASAEQLATSARAHGRNDMAEENERVVNLLTTIK
ncbi:tyrosine-type recombinase/integrase [Dermabacteraceae bacterium P13095]